MLEHRQDAYLSEHQIAQLSADSELGETMASLNLAGGSWTSTEGNDMLPGDVHEWTNDCDFNQAVAITAFPVKLGGVQRLLSVVDTFIEASPDQRWILHWKIKNVGLEPIDGYTWAWLLANNQGVDGVFNLGDD